MRPFSGARCQSTPDRSGRLTLRSSLARGLAAAIACVSPTTALGVPVAEIGANTFAVNVSGSTLTIRYDANLPLAGPYPQIERVVVLLHGTSRNVQNAYDTLVEATQLAGADDGTALLVAPQFLTEEDVVAHQLSAQALFWSDSGWREGDRSLSTLAHPRPARISSFAVLDSMLARIAIQAPNATSIVVAGHSAGGQFFNRFAAGSRIADVLDDFGIDLAHVVANPSSYLYLSPERVAGSLNVFAVPPAATIQSCPSYNDYKYGLDDRNNYMSQLTSAQLVARYRDAQVTMLLGAEDDDPNGPDLDTTCAAMLQGTNRLERGRIFHYFLRDLFGSSIDARHRTRIVPDVGHSSHDMFTSPCGVEALFGTGGCDPVDAAQEGGSFSGSLPFLRCRPNPFRDHSLLTYRVARAGQWVTIDVYDVRGRAVRALRGETADDGAGAVVWDGRDGAGRRVPAGVYLCRIRGADHAVVERAIVRR